MSSQTRTKATDPNSMYAWLPAVAKAGVPSPRTEMVYCGLQPMVELMDHKPLPNTDEIIAAGERVGYPVFLRTDLASGKHGWDDTCFVPRPDLLLRHAFAVIEFNQVVNIIGLDCVALAFREYVELESSFKAFCGMPVARERRYFAEAGKVLCHHPYWIEDAIGNYGAPHQPMLPPDWRQRLASLNREGPEITLLSQWAARVSSELDGAWSIDFAHAKNGRWLLIDMALAAESWHPECEMPGVQA